MVSPWRGAASPPPTGCFRVVAAGSAGPERSVGGLRRGATRLRSPCRFAFHPGSAGPARSVGGLRRRGSPLLSASRVAVVQLLAALGARLVVGVVLRAPRVLPLEREAGRHRVPPH